MMGMYVPPSRLMFRMFTSPDECLMAGLGLSTFHIDGACPRSSSVPQEFQLRHLMF